MRPMANSAVEVTTRGNLMENQSLVPAVKELWNLWEIHCLILVSLFLQVFLFLFAGMRRRSSSSILSTVLWLAYLAADSVAIFVLGHLAVHASEPEHQLMSFWAPFVLIHLGGQDTITAFSKQDNELWRRHLLSLVTQVALAGYVVAKASWSDSRLKAAMVIMFLSGFFKYAERTSCLSSASPTGLRSGAMRRLKHMLQGLREDDYGIKSSAHIVYMRETLDMMSKGSIGPEDDDHDIIDDIMSADAPLITASSIEVADELPGMLKEFLSGADRYRAYEHVGARLLRCYQRLYTKNPPRVFFWETFPLGHILSLPCVSCCCYEHCNLDWSEEIGSLLLTFFYLWYLFQYVSAPIALALFWAAEKGGQDQLHTSKADITLSYVLLIGAIVLDVSSATMYFFNFTLKGSRIRNAILRVANRILPAWSRKQWSEQLAQYSMIKRHIRQDTSGMASIQQWIGRHLGAWGVELLDLTHTPIARDHTLIKEFILDSLLAFGERKEWNIASSRGRRAIREWMIKHNIPDSERPGKALVKTISHGVDFPTSVLIWHNATEICYHCSEDGDDTSNNSHQQLKKHKQLSRELSNYIMYLVFKCGVMLPTISEFVHDTAHDEIASVLSDAHLGGEKAAAMKLFKSKEGEQKDSTVETKTHEELTDEQQDLVPDQQDSTLSEIQKLQELADNDSAAGNHHIKKLRQSAQALKSPVLPRAHEVAKELININDATDRWGLIADVWAEMLFFTAPRCGAAFHYEHLSTGGEFITHVLLLMKFLGPFLPPPGA